MSETKAMPVALLEWRPFTKNSLRGFAKIRVGSSLIIRDVTLNVSNGKRWASMPSKPITNPDGTPKIGDRGKPVYVPILEWASRDAADRFSEAVIQAVEREYPGATEA